MKKMKTMLKLRLATNGAQLAWPLRITARKEDSCVEITPNPRSVVEWCCTSLYGILVLECVKLCLKKFLSYVLQMPDSSDSYRNTFVIQIPGFQLLQASRVPIIELRKKEKKDGCTGSDQRSFDSFDQRLV